MEEANGQHEATSTQLRKKHQDAVNEMAMQIEQMHKGQNRMEKEKTQVKAQLDEQKVKKYRLNAFKKKFSFNG